MSPSAEHDRSYYAATINDDARYPALQSEISVDICVIGGGFSGVAAALTLAERGRSVALLEAKRIGWGASGRNGGQVLPGWSGESTMIRQLGEKAHEFLWRTRYRGNEIIESWIEKYQIDCDYVRGAMTTATKPLHMKFFEAEYHESSEHGLGDDIVLLGRNELRDYLDTDVYLGGLLEKRAGHCHPLNLCLGEARAARNLGVEIFEGTPALEIIHGDRAEVVAEGGRVRAGSVVLAGNAYHYLEKRRLHGYMLPAQTYMMATEPLPDELAKTILPHNTAVCDANWVLDYFRLSADRRMLFGGRCTYSNRQIHDVEAALRPRMRRIFPQLDGVNVDYSWGGAIAIPLNRTPLLGRIDSNIFYVQGYSGHGVNCSHIAAEIIADAIESSDRDLSLFERVTHFRMPAADLIGGPMLALGMTYYRMKDSIGV